jgi:hypothetical protein
VLQLANELSRITPSRFRCSCCLGDAWCFRRKTLVFVQVEARSYGALAAVIINTAVACRSSIFLLLGAEFSLHDASGRRVARLFSLAASVLFLAGESRMCPLQRCHCHRQSTPNPRRLPSCASFTYESLHLSQATVFLLVHSSCDPSYSSSYQRSLPHCSLPYTPFNSTLKHCA